MIDYQLVSECIDSKIFTLTNEVLPPCRFFLISILPPNRILTLLLFWICKDDTATIGDDTGTGAGAVSGLSEADLDELDEKLNALESEDLEGFA